MKKIIIMKMQTSISFTTITKEDLQMLTTEVKETLAKSNNQKRFSTIDLWNIQRNKKQTHIRSLAN